MGIAQVHRAAVARFAQQGYAATGIRDLGSAAGINSATLYHYVGSKQELLIDIISGCLNSMISGGRDALSTDSSPKYQLAQLVAFHVGFTATNPLTARVAEYEMRSLPPGPRADLQQLRDDYEELFAQVLRDGEREGSFQTADLGMARLAIMEMGTGVSHWYWPGGRLSLPQVQLNFVAMVMRILAVSVAPLSEQQLPVVPVLDSEPITPLKSPTAKGSTR